MSRAEHEIIHGKYLAGQDTELIWGWGTPAGRVRAQRRAQLIAQGAGLAPGKRVLEIGCGTGLFSEYFAQSGADVVAVDISEDLIAKAMERKLPANVQFLVKRFEDCDVEGPFDGIVGSSILHHLELEAALNKMAQLLKPGGRISFGEPNMLNPQVFVQFNFREWFPYVSPDEKAFIKWQLYATLCKAGFVDVEILPMDWLHPAVPRHFVELVQKLGGFVEQLPLLKEFSGSLYIRAARPLSA